MLAGVAKFLQLGQLLQSPQQQAVEDTFPEDKEAPSLAKESCSKLEFGV